MKNTNEEKPKVQPIDLFSTSFCGYAMQISLFYHWTTKIRGGREGWQEQTYWKYICGCISIECITQINAINIYYNERYSVDESLHTLHTHTIRKMIRHKFYVYDPMFCIHLHQIFFSFLCCYFNWMHFQLYSKSSFFDFQMMVASLSSFSAWKGE